MNIPKCYEFNVVLWFLPCFFVCSLFFHELIKLSPSKITLYLITVLLLVFDTLFCNKISLPFFIPQALCALPFMICGYLLKDATANIGRWVESLLLKKYIVLFICIVLLCLQGFWPYGFGMLGNSYHGIFWIFAICALCAFLLVYIISSIISRNFILEWLGKNSLVIMLIHEPIKRIVLKIYSTVIHLPIESVRLSIVHSCIVVSVIILVCVPFVLFINKYTPFLIGRSVKKTNT